jgi:hypothetical protein
MPFYRHRKCWDENKAQSEHMILQLELSKALLCSNNEMNATSRVPKMK